MIYTIWDATEEYTCVIVEDRTYDILHDKWTGDWSVNCHEDEQVQGQWFMTEDDAVKYALQCAEVLEDANYDRAPDRTSA